MLPRTYWFASQAVSAGDWRDTSAAHASMRSSDRRRPLGRGWSREEEQGKRQRADPPHAFKRSTTGVC